VDRDGAFFIRAQRQLFIAKAPEEIKMRESEKAETKDARSSKRGNK
jgi:hypothetical protein